MDARYVLEKVRHANRLLANGAGRIRERLHDAFRALDSLHPEHFPEGDARESFADFRRRIVAVKAIGAEGRVRATLLAMSDEDAIKLAHVLQRVEYELETEVEHRRPAG